MTPTAKLTTRGLARRAWAIHRDPSRAQDIDILCPVHVGGWYCQWVAGHYGGCVPGRSGQQRGLVA